ncbi:hypothetical protein H6F98_06365 [Microcoleus sp. FACHB-SPT15]|uniref:hypothetical protein n=1 Tax=Microcoleus sp. FACHB-SPT15 TaxID=2692830 RepID=UPI0017836FD9|nr:hypothetical protein [Microcoleus sp. FACHB-SPT15]MBD1805074.1 hypothetical protein [Microcoleus sp. FACHB-SPT15]
MLRVLWTASPGFLRSRCILLLIITLGQKTFLNYLSPSSRQSGRDYVWHWDGASNCQRKCGLTQKIRCQLEKRPSSVLIAPLSDKMRKCLELGK